TALPWPKSDLHHEQMSETVDASGAVAHAETGELLRVPGKTVLVRVACRLAHDARGLTVAHRISERECHARDVTWGSYASPRPLNVLDVRRLCQRNDLIDERRWQRKAASIHAVLESIDLGPGLIANLAVDREAARSLERAHPGVGDAAEITVGDEHAELSL